MNRPRTPQFIIIGAMKCATSTLHEQLARQPGLFMSTPKEPCFFSDDDAWARGIDWYLSLFSAAPSDAICGESSTHYAKLPTYPHTVGRMRQHLGSDVKFIYIMRHPIDRLISQYVHEWTQRVVSDPIDRALDVFPAMIEYSRYAMQLSPYIDAFGPQRILPMFFERFAADPQGELERVCRFIGHEGVPRWDEAISEQNVSTERMRTSTWRDAIVNLPGLKHARRTLVPQSVRNRIKQFWMMRHRPQLSDRNIERLRELFDEDLATLGRWLGLDLNCERFKAIASQTAAQWASKARVVVA